MKTIYIIAIAILFIVLLFFIYTYLTIPDFKPTVKQIEIYSESFDEKIFIKQKNWGIIGDDQVIVITKSSDINFEPNINEEYTFKGLSPFFYDFRNDTLFLYVNNKSEIPKNMVSEIRIVQIELTNPEMMNLMKNYRERGLKKIE